MEQSREWARNPVRETERVKSLKQRILDGDSTLPTLQDYVALEAPQPLTALVFEIIRRESGWKYDICNQTTADGCNAGQGLMQVIPSTEKVCEEHFEREMDMLTVVDNLDCGLWLLGDGSGITHWDDLSWKKGEKKRWGSGPYYLSNFLDTE